MLSAVSSLVVLAVGKVKEPGLRDAIDDYVKRIERHFSYEEIEVKDAPMPALRAALEKKLPDGAHVTALDARGRSMTSESFARWVESRMSTGKGKIVFLIGGADGLPPEILARANDKLSLSQMTFPHRLARLVLVEQLYRAVTILRGEPYARL
jgi:23S rRNA (pseudouridine1915-N3)-methyltransferase